MIIVMVDEEPDGSDVVGKFFEEGQGFTDEAWTALSQSIIEAFYVVGLN